MCYSIALFSSYLILGIYFTSLIVEKKFNETIKLVELDPASIASLNIKINYLVDVVGSGIWSTYLQNYFVYMVFVFFSSVLFGVLISHFADNQRLAFILLSDKAKEYEKVVTRNSTKKWCYLGLTVFAGIITSVLGNYIYYRLFSEISS